MGENDLILRQLLWFCWAIYTHRNEVLFKGVPPSPHQIVNLWHKELQKINFFKFAAADLHNFTVTPSKQRPSHNQMHSWKKEDILIAGQRFKHSRKSVFVAFCFTNDNPHLLYYFCEIDRDGILATFFKGLRNFLEISTDFRGMEADIICQNNFNPKSADLKVSTYVADIHHMIDAPDNKWKLSQCRHNLKIKSLWPWIDSFIAESFCSM